MYILKHVDQTTCESFIVKMNGVETSKHPFSKDTVDLETLQLNAPERLFNLIWIVVCLRVHLLFSEKYAHKGLHYKS